MIKIIESRENDLFALLVYLYKVSTTATRTSLVQHVK